MIPTLYIYSDDNYYALGIKNLCEANEINFSQLVLDTTNTKKQYSGIDFENAVLAIDVEGMSFDKFDAVINSTLCNSFVRKLLILRNSNEENVKPKQCTSHYFISKKITPINFIAFYNSENLSYIDDWSNYYRLMRNETALLDDFIQGLPPSLISITRGICQKKVYQKRQYFIERCGFSRYTPKSLMNSFFLCHAYL